MNNKKKISSFETKEFVLVVIIAMIIWWVPKWIFNIQGAIISGLLPVISFTIGYFVVILLRSVKRSKNE